MDEETLELGMTAKDKITGFQGMITGRCTYLTGCAQLLLIPRIVKEDGTKPGGEWFERQRLSRVGTDQLVLANDETPGADIEAPKK